MTTGALAYLVISTLGIAAFFLVAGLLTPEGDEEVDEALPLEPYDPAGDRPRGATHCSPTRTRAGW